jgi:hypothetical protein
MRGNKPSEISSSVPRATTKIRKMVQPGFNSLGFLLLDTSLYRIFFLAEKTHDWQGQVFISIRMI